jgi:hypothetical protein
MNRKIRFGLSVLVLTVPFLLAACGGGGGGGVALQPPAGPNIVTMFASLDNTQETTPSLSTARGFGLLSLNTDTNRIAGFIVDDVAAGTAAHIHGPAARGEAAGVLVPLIGAGPGLWVLPDGAELPAANAADFADGLLYYNVHTAENPAGEIRGQIDMTPTEISFASLDNTQETTPSLSTARGFGILAFDSVTDRIAGAIVDDVAAGTAAHIHGLAARGVPAGVLVPLIGAGPGLWVLPDGAELPAANAADFADGLLYYNVHTAVNPDGEIRGQIDLP